MSFSGWTRKPAGNDRLKDNRSPPGLRPSATRTVGLGKTVMDGLFKSGRCALQTPGTQISSQEAGMKPWEAPFSESTSS
jgi:hypothetical protein